MMNAPAGSKKTDLKHLRVTVESVYIAIVLAFVLRAFMIEAFVIPTGSMANALYGEHYQLHCPSCGYEYAYGFQKGGQVLMGQGVIPNKARCPNCGYLYSAYESSRRVFRSGGDRVLVLKYLYDFIDLKPWDVMVFKNPQNNRENYIKRLIGLPGEAIEIVRGDIFFSKDGGETWWIRRKPCEVQDAVWQIVYDNNFPPNPLMVEAAGIHQPRWEKETDEKSWDLSPYGGRVLAFSGAQQQSRLTFHPGDKGFHPENGYNQTFNERQSTNSETDICTDWKLSFVVMPGETTDTQVNLIFESFNDRFRGEINFNGLVRLLHQTRWKDPDNPDEWTVWGREDVGAFLPGRGRKIALTNVDFRLTLWVDGKAILSSTDEQLSGDYAAAKVHISIRERIQDNTQRIESLNTRIDRIPAGSTEAKELRAELKAKKLERGRLAREQDWFRTPGVQITAAGGAFQLWHVQLHRDVYYTAPSLKNPSINPGAEYDFVRRMLTGKGAPAGRNSWKRDENGKYLGWGTIGNPIHLRKHPKNRDLDEFFCLGDNSPQSLDGRSWTAAAPSLRLYDEEEDFQYQLGTVPRYNILGRALLVYWPAGFRLPVLRWPIVPNVGKMRLIR